MYPLRLLSLTLVIAGMSLLSGCQTMTPSKRVESTAITAAYGTETWRYAPEGPGKGVTIVYLHGKGASPESPHNARFIANMTALGYEVVAPLMPWSPLQGYRATRDDGIETIRVAVASAATGRVVVIGHSMGGMAVLQYGAGEVAANVIGLVSIAPGHDPNTNGALRSHTEADAARACAAMAAGGGGERGRYAEMKSGSTYYIDATADYYCTHYSVDQYPNSLQIGRGIDRPFLLVSGSGDKLTRSYFHDRMYASVADTGRNAHWVLSGDHGSVLYLHNDALASWIDAL